MAKNYCLDCKSRIMSKGWFMVKDPLWEKYGVGENFLCIDCFEKRMDRKLEASDLIRCVVNEEVNPYTVKIFFG